ncbi:Uncharacterised protein [Paucimonas lemoignei]|nr:Uncharacterised protein [Paucimonas lemoignei]
MTSKKLPQAESNRVLTQRRSQPSAAPTQKVYYFRPSAPLATSSVLAAMMKSLRCRPLIE